MKVCARPGCEQPTEARSKYCSDACRDTTQRAAKQLRKPKGIPRRTYRVYDYRRPPEAPP